MSEAADDMFDDWLRNSESMWCSKHRCYYDPECACVSCEDGLPPDEITNDREGSGND